MHLGGVSNVEKIQNTFALETKLYQKSDCSLDVHDSGTFQAMPLSATIPGGAEVGRRISIEGVAGQQK